MARNDDSKRDDGTPARVFKSSDVHKRRVDRKGREKRQEAVEPDEPSKEAVVITPQFGGRTQAQRDADDRWFAAMRDANAPAEALGDPFSEPVKPEPEAPSAEAPPVEAPVDDAPPTPEPSAEKPPAQEPPAQEPPAKPAFKRQPVEEEPSQRKRPSLWSTMSIKRRIAVVVAIALILALAVGAFLFTWNRWYRFDDHADLQGQWYVVGTTVPVTIDDGSIHLTDDVTYQYEIDTQSKTLKYTFGQMEGQGRYWFSDDRQYLVITDGDEFTSASTAFDDLLTAFGGFLDGMYGKDFRLPEGDGIIAFSREPDAEALAREEAEAAAKAAAEEAERKEKERREAEEAAAWEAEWEEYYYYEEEEGGSTEETPAEEAPSEETPAEEG